MTADALVLEDAQELSTHADRIVVGLDGSAESLVALRWAVEQARRTGSRIEAVYVYEPTAEVTLAFGGYPAVTPIDAAEVRRSAQAVLAEALHQVPAADVAVEPVVVADGSPSRTLTQMAHGAAMLVVGAHHRSGFGLLLGSTAGSCVRHAVSPVVVVPVTGG